MYFSLCDISAIYQRSELSGFLTSRSLQFHKTQSDYSAETPPKPYHKWTFAQFAQLTTFTITGTATVILKSMLFIVFLTIYCKLNKTENQLNKISARRIHVVITRLYKSYMVKLYKKRVIVSKLNKVSVYQIQTSLGQVKFLCVAVSVDMQESFLSGKMLLNT